eukprot:4516616-Prymnesium_polylepis.1
MWQGFEKVRRPPYSRATQAPPPAHPLITRTAPRHRTKHVFRTGLSTACITNGGVVLFNGNGA